VSLPKITVKTMDGRNGQDVLVGEHSTVYLEVAGVRVRASVHKFDQGAELNLVVDPKWSAENPVNAIDIVEVRATASQAALRVRGMDERR
jgi:hypothetical protein